MTISKSIRVERPPEISFKVFCEEIGQCGQRARHSAARTWRT
jgi:hypothetical protein